MKFRSRALLLVFSLTVLATRPVHEGVKFQISPGNINKPNFKGNTPLITASGVGNKELVKELLNANANVNLANRGGYTALMFAAANSHTDIVYLLLKAGANKHQRNLQGKTTLQIAQESGAHEELINLLEFGDIEKIR